MESREERCKEEGCKGRVYARGWCGKHYKRWQRTGSTKREPRPTVCTVDGCDKPVDARGWCHGHYQRWLRTGDVEADTPLRDRERDECSVDGCDRAVHARRLCVTHYQRWRKHGSPLEDVDIREVEGNGYVHHHGYRYVPVPAELRHLSNGERTIAEHRLVMARHLRRPLTSEESVHHLNGDRLDNRPENLELWSTAQPRGQRVADKITFAVEILRCYAPEQLGDSSSIKLLPGGDLRREGSTRDQHLRNESSPLDSKPIGPDAGTVYEHNGYRMVPVPPDQRHLTGGRRMYPEHRLVMALRLARPLERDENVHHVNGDRLDNRPENLELWSTSQPSGQRVRDKIAFALELLDRYAPDVLAYPIEIALEHIDASSAIRCSPEEI